MLMSDKYQTEHEVNAECVLESKGRR